MKDQRHTRRDYTAPALRRADLPEDPLVLFEQWFAEAAAAEIQDATAMALATANGAGVPSVRIVLLKHFGAEGFCWYTDYRSRKGKELADNPRAECLFHWRELSRQVRIAGTVTGLDAADADSYFHSRPADSRFSAAASHQSRPVASREMLESRVEELQRQYPDGDVPRPPEWGGYCLQPVSYEFWQGREGRLHDRFRYLRQHGGWLVDRLQP